MSPAPCPAAAAAHGAAGAVLTSPQRQRRVGGQQLLPGAAATREIPHTLAPYLYPSPCSICRWPAGAARQRQADTLPSPPASDGLTPDLPHPTLTSGRATKRVACRPGVGGAAIPRVCDAAALPGQSNQCGQDPYIVLPDRSECVDQQTLKIQV